MEEKRATSYLKGNRKGADIVRRPGKESKLGEVVSEYITQHVKPRQTYFSEIAGIWNELLPADLRTHCVLKDFTEGRLYVSVDSSAYMYELKLMSSDLLREIRQRLRGTQGSRVGQAAEEIKPIRQLKFIPG